MGVGFTEGYILVLNFWADFGDMLDLLSFVLAILMLTFGSMLYFMGLSIPEPERLLELGNIVVESGPSISNLL